MYIYKEELHYFILDKNHLITDFQAQIKASEELRALYESVDKDKDRDSGSAGANDTHSPMDLS